MKNKPLLRRIDSGFVRHQLLDFLDLGSEVNSIVSSWIYTNLPTASVSACPQNSPQKQKHPLYHPGRNWANSDDGRENKRKNTDCRIFVKRFEWVNLPRKGFYTEHQSTDSVRPSGRSRGEKPGKGQQLEIFQRHQPGVSKYRMYKSRLSTRPNRWQWRTYKIVCVGFRMPVMALRMEWSRAGTESRQRSTEQVCRL